MDLEAFIDVNRAEWDELDRLVKRRRLTEQEADRLVVLYGRVNTHLSVVRSTDPDPVLVSRLSQLLLRARSRLAGGREPFLGELRRFFGSSFPAAVWRLRWWLLGVTVWFFAVAVWSAFWIGGNADLQAAIGGRSQIDQLVNHDFVDYYSEHPHSAFALQVWTNNAWVTAQCVAFGVFGVLVPFVLFQNALNTGLIAGLMVTRGHGTVFFAYLLPHGLLEITAVLVAAAAGMRLFWSWVAPGPLPRAESMAREGRALFTVAMGLVVVLAVSGVLEGFITPSGFPTWLRLAIGVVVWLAFLVYVTVLGRAAVREGHTGDLRSDQAGAVVPTAG